MNNLLLEEENNIDLNNVFIVSIVFGTNAIQKTVLAADIEEAIETVKIYYEDPIILGVVKVNEIVDLLDSVQEELNPIFIMEMKEEDGKLKLESTKIDDKTIEELQEEYNKCKKEAVFFDKESLIFAINNALKTLEKKAESLLLSDSYLAIN